CTGFRGRARVLRRGSAREVRGVRGDDGGGGGGVGPAHRIGYRVVRVHGGRAEVRVLRKGDRRDETRVSQPRVAAYGRPTTVSVLTLDGASILARSSAAGVAKW